MTRQVGPDTFSYTYHPDKKHAVSNINLNTTTTHSPMTTTGT